MAKCTGIRRPMQHGYKVDECNHTDCPYRTEPMTNADRIRAMSDEELAEFLESTHTNMAIKLGDEYIVRAKEHIGIWLKQPAEE